LNRKSEGRKVNAMLILVSTFALVFALGMQSQFVNNSHYIGAFLNSGLISISQLGALQIIHAQSAWEYAAYMLGGPLGIVSSMFLYRFYKTNMTPQRRTRSAMILTNIGKAPIILDRSEIKKNLFVRLMIIGLLTILPALAFYFSFKR
jgi:hypothetical protein